MHGFLNYFKNNSTADDVTVTTFLLHLLAILQAWVKEGSSLRVVDPQLLFKLSCKMDGLLLIFLGRANVRIRRTCLSILMLMHTILENMSIKAAVPGLSLFTILMKFDDAIGKEAIFAFATQQMSSNALEPLILGGLDILSFFEVAACEYSHLYRFFYGAAVSFFALHGRHKAIRHCGKFLKQMVVQTITNMKQVTQNSLFDHTSNMILLLGLAGATVRVSIFGKPVITLNQD
jgi:hypothetical protein